MLSVKKQVFWKVLYSWRCFCFLLLPNGHRCGGSRNIHFSLVSQGSLRNSRQWEPAGRFFRAHFSLTLFASAACSSPYTLIYFGSYVLYTHKLGYKHPGCFTSPLPLCACPCMYMRVEAGDWYRMSLVVVARLVFWDRVAHWTWSWPIWLHHQASKFQGPSCPCQPRDYKHMLPTAGF